MGANATKQSIYSTGDCPVCADSGAVLLLKAVGSEQMVLFCPLCGVAWREPPADRCLDEIEALPDLAPNGVVLPTGSEALSTGFALTEVAFDKWNSWLQRTVKHVYSLDPARSRKTLSYQ